jgi:hypothetical protein
MIKGLKRLKEDKKNVEPVQNRSENAVAHVEYAVTMSAKQTVVQHIHTAASSCMTHIQGQQ